MAEIYNNGIIKIPQYLKIEKYKILNILMQIEHLNINLQELKNCGEIQPNGKIYFCKKRYCPICNNHRSRKFYAKMNKRMAELKQDTRYKATKYFFITLGTAPTPAENITNKIDAINKAYKKLVRNRKISNYNLGYIRALEIKYKTNNTFNIHLHLIIAVKSTYIKKDNYLSSKKWQELWQKYLNVAYIPDAKVKTPQKEEFAKIAGYIGKGSNLQFGIENEFLNNFYNVGLDEDTKKDIYYYLTSISNRKFYTSTGILKI